MKGLLRIDGEEYVVENLLHYRLVQGGVDEPFDFLIEIETAKAGPEPPSSPPDEAAVDTAIAVSTEDVKKEAIGVGRPSVKGFLTPDTAITISLADDPDTVRALIELRAKYDVKFTDRLPLVGETRLEKLATKYYVTAGGALSLAMTELIAAERVLLVNTKETRLHIVETPRAVFNKDGSKFKLQESVHVVPIPPASPELPIELDMKETHD